MILVKTNHHSLRVGRHNDLDEMLQNVESGFYGKSQNDMFSQILKDYETPLFSDERENTISCILY
jgi:hypothetical protein